MNTKAYLIVSTIIFSGVALVHLLRISFEWTAQIGSWTAALWVSLPVLLVSGSVAVGGWSLTRRVG